MRLNPDTMRPAIDLYKNIESYSGTAHSFVEQLGRFGVVGKQIQLYTASQYFDRTIEFPWFDRHGISNIRKPIRRKIPGLSQRRNSYCSVMSGGLDLRNFDAFVGLDMWPQTYSVASRDSADPLSILLYSIQIEKQRGCFHRRDAHVI
jgi:hypothetical protein